MPGQNVSEPAGGSPLGVLTDPLRELGPEPEGPPARTPGGEQGLRAALDRGEPGAEPPATDDLR
ncbi:MAG TPA: hypothetical protein VJT75_03505 [Thermoleophilaceae bacterium]|nr:hypothetical protein [Thermoleophilaceae bacterium]